MKEGSWLFPARAVAPHNIGAARSVAAGCCGFRDPLEDFSGVRLSQPAQRQGAGYYTHPNREQVDHNAAFRRHPEWQKGCVRGNAIDQQLEIKKPGM